MIKINCLKNYNELSSAAADIVAEKINSRYHFNLACPTGRTPVGMYKKLVACNINWQSVSTYNLDEYIGLDYNHPGTYKYYMNQHLHQHVLVDSVYYPSADYDSIITNRGGLDLSILGLGLNGHIAFNEPGSKIDSTSRIVELSPETVNANSKDWPWETPFPTHAITMGVKTILESQSILLLVSGISKLEVLERALYGPIADICPASYLQTHSDLTVLYCE